MNHYIITEGQSVPEGEWCKKNGEGL